MRNLQTIYTNTRFLIIKKQVNHGYYLPIKNTGMITSGILFFISLHCYMFVYDNYKKYRTYSVDALYLKKKLLSLETSMQHHLAEREFKLKAKQQLLSLLFKNKSETQVNQAVERLFKTATFTHTQIQTITIKPPILKNGLVDTRFCVSLKGTFAMLQAFLKQQANSLHFIHVLKITSHYLNLID